MELLRSLQFLSMGVLKRIYWLLPTLLLDPFDLVERLCKVSYEVPQWAIWTLFSLGWAIAITLTYHDLRMQKINLEKPPNWIEAYKKTHRKLPPIQSFMSGEVSNYSSGMVVSKNIQLITPSAQFWKERLPSEKKQLLELVEWLGQDSRDYEAMIKKMSPHTGTSMRLHR